MPKKNPETESPEPSLTTEEARFTILNPDELHGLLTRAGMHEKLAEGHEEGTLLRAYLLGRRDEAKAVYTYMNEAFTPDVIATIRDGYAIKIETKESK